MPDESLVHKTLSSTRVNIGADEFNDAIVYHFGLSDTENPDFNPPNIESFSISTIWNGYQAVHLYLQEHWYTDNLKLNYILTFSPYINENKPLQNKIPQGMIPLSKNSQLTFLQHGIYQTNRLLWAWLFGVINHKNNLIICHQKRRFISLLELFSTASKSHTIYNINWNKMLK